MDDHPVEDGGLGWDLATAALIVGHSDGGYLISTVYTKLSEKRARKRAQLAMDAYEERTASEEPRLRIVND